MTANIKALHCCNFCNKNQTQVKTLVAGNNTYICNECVLLCMDVISPQEKIASVPKELTPPKIVEYLDQHVIGQMMAKRALGVAIYNHLKRINNPVVDGVVIDKSNILMIGSSGVGKSHMVTTLARVLNVPFAIVDATSLSQTGYVGLDPEECLVRLYHAAEGDLERAEKGIIFLDEIDKIGRKSGENVSTTRDVSGEGVQQALLKIIEGNDVKFSAAGGRKNPNGEFVTINTRNILFILGGAFEGLDKVIQSRLSESTTGIGFLGDVREPNSNDRFRVVSQTQTEDLISYGMIPELVGRIPVILTFEDLDKSTLRRILVEPKNAITKQFEKLFELDGIKLEFEPDSLDAVAEQVLRTRTGARGLRMVLERVLLNRQYELPLLKQQGVRAVKVSASNVLDQTEPETLA